jgi:hypothetical protein
LLIAKRSNQRIGVSRLAASLGFLITELRFATVPNRGEQILDAVVIFASGIAPVDLRGSHGVEGAANRNLCRGSVESCNHKQPFPWWLNSELVVNLSTVCTHASRRALSVRAKTMQRLRFATPRKGNISSRGDERFDPPRALRVTSLPRSNSVSLLRRWDSAPNAPGAATRPHG